MGERKNNQKCVRISDEVLKVVESYRGDGFNQKFENLVLDFIKLEPERKKAIAALDKEIEQKQNVIDRLTANINRGNEVQRYLDNFIQCISTS